ncbi:Zinc finger MYM-type protein 1 [Orchesella cincta]|uniref:Zinc finger MYM-type protein 1 n=1 Tax=Orchesella cincta TaxID=48709 RepID=A0A1D2MAQ9_ORCCI|nr:Zinc finger MYM-type protein 1 [Orchesella cincta]
MVRPTGNNRAIADRQLSGHDKAKKRKKLEEDKRKSVTRETFQLDRLPPPTPTFKVDANKTPADQMVPKSNMHLSNEQLADLEKSSQPLENLASVEVVQDESVTILEPSEVNVEDQADNIIDKSDPSSWPYPLTDSFRRQLIERGPVQKRLKCYPRDESGRSFHNEHYERTMDTGEIRIRDWILYSESSTSLFCFPCCLFSPTPRSSSWTNFGESKIGFTNYVHQSKAIKDHENSRHHASAVVLKSMLQAALFLAKNNLAFRGTTEKIGAPDCGNFLSLIELLSHYHPPLARHIDRLEKGKTSYMSPKIQNEFLSLSANSVRKSIISKIQQRKYFAILFDATPDISHDEQISEVIRTVNISKNGCSIEENFLGFLHFDKKKGSQISDLILKKLHADGLDIMNCRGQGYDNGANMSGIYNGVQAHIKRVNEYAEFIPCVAHTLNLVGQNATSKVLPGKLILGQIQNLYSFFSSSPYRWNMLKPHVNQVLKCQSQTRWSSKASAVSTLYEEFEGVLESLLEVINSDDTNSATLVEATANFNHINNFRFLLGLTVWNVLLSRINITTTAIQKKDIDIETSAKLLGGLLSSLIKFKETGFQECLKKAKEKAEAIGIDEDTGFQYRLTRNQLPKRFRRQTSEVQEAVSKSNVEKFQEEFFDKVMETLIIEIRSRFSYIEQASKDFCFLWGKALATFTTSELQKASIDLSTKYSLDLDRALDILNILTINDLQDVYPNCHTAIRIFLTLPVTIAGNERSFSKLKIIKNYLRSTMGQERLCDLAILSIEHAESSSLSLDSLINDFAEAKCRKVPI